MRTTLWVLGLLLSWSFCLFPLACNKAAVSTATPGTQDTNNTQANDSNNATSQNTASLPVQATLGAAGGALATAAGDATLTLPANALSANATLTVTQRDAASVASAGLALASDVFDFGPDGTQFTLPVTLALRVNPMVSPTYAVLATLAENGRWQPLTGSTYNSVTGTVSASITHFTVYAVIVLPNQGMGCAAFADPNAFCAPSACDTNANACAGTAHVSGTISGLVTGTALTIHNGSTSRTASYPDTTFTFAQAFPDGTPYAISIDGNSPGLSCTLTDGTGTVGNAGAPAPHIACALRLVFADNQNATTIVGQNDAVSTVSTVDDQHFSQPYAAFGAANQYLYVSDSNNFRVLGFAAVPSHDGAAANLVLGQASFNTRTDWADAGAPGPNQMRACGLAGDDNILLVTDCDAHRAVIFASLPLLSNPNASVALGQNDLVTAGSHCGASGLFNPQGAVVVHGKIIIADAGNHRVLVWNSVPQASGTPADLVLGQQDFNTCSQPTQASAATMDEPSGVWSDGVRLLVADAFNNRVLAWNAFPTSNAQPADAVLGQQDLNTTTNADPTTQTNTPISVACNGNQIFVSEYGAHRISIWEGFPTAQSSSLFTGVLGQPNKQSISCNQSSAQTPPAANTLCTPVGVQVVGNEVLVADWGNNRVVAYQSR